MRIIYLIISIVIISGCSKNEQPRTTKEYLQIKDKRNHYIKAYSHGCSSKKGIYKKNKKRYNENQTYLEGWNEGYYNCGKRNYNNSQGFQDGYNTAKTGKVSIRSSDKLYKIEFKKGYYSYMQKYR